MGMGAVATLLKGAVAVAVGAGGTDAGAALLKGAVAVAVAVGAGCTRTCGCNNFNISPLIISFIFSFCSRALFFFCICSTYLYL
jgi:hypothetical protein